MNKEYNNVVLVIGNGFDLDLGLPTSYSSFIRSPYFDNHVSELQKDSDTWNSPPDSEYLFDFLYSQIDWKDSRHLDAKKWVDIENELINFATRGNGTLSSSIEADEKEKKMFYLLQEELCNYLSNISYDNVNKNSYAIKVLNSVNNLLGEIISFNYTDLSKLNPFLSNPLKLPIEYVHGKLADKTIILGVQDNVDFDSSYSFLIKTFSPHYKSHNVRKKLLNADEIIFFGHSLGNTDYHYFQELFKRQSNPDTAKDNLFMRIFTFDEESRRNILLQLREMNDKRTNFLFDLCDFELYRTKDKQDDTKIEGYLEALRKRIHQGLKNLVKEYIVLKRNGGKNTTIPFVIPK